MHDPFADSRLESIHSEIFVVVVTNNSGSIAHDKHAGLKCSPPGNLPCPLVFFFFLRGGLPASLVGVSMVCEFVARLAQHC